MIKFKIAIITLAIPTAPTIDHARERLAAILHESGIVWFEEIIEEGVSQHHGHFVTNWRVSCGELKTVCAEHGILWHRTVIDCIPNNQDN